MTIGGPGSRRSHPRPRPRERGCSWRSTAPPWDITQASSWGRRSSALPRVSRARASARQRPSYAGRSGSPPSIERRQSGSSLLTKSLSSVTFLQRPDDGEPSRPVASVRCAPAARQSHHNSSGSSGLRRKIGTYVDREEISAQWPDLTLREVRQDSNLQPRSWRPVAAFLAGSNARQHIAS